MWSLRKSFQRQHLKGSEVKGVGRASVQLDLRLRCIGCPWASCTVTARCAGWKLESGGNVDGEILRFGIRVPQGENRLFRRPRGPAIHRKPARITADPMGINKDGRIAS